MPLARIITRFPEHTSTLSQQLQLEGYSVEIASPGEIHAQPADLEIDFALCNPAEALQRASHRANELGADVVVASGVLELAMQAAEVPEVHTQHETQEVPAEALAAESIPAEPITTQLEESSPELPPYNPHFARNLGTQLREALAGLGASAAALRKRLAEHLKVAIASTRSRMATAKTNIASAAASLASRAQEHREPIKQEQQAIPEPQAVEISQQVEPQEPLVVGDLPALHEPELAVVPMPPVQKPSPAIPVVAAARRSPAKRQRRTPLQLRGIFIGAAAASVLFVVGLLLANVHQQSPFPTSMPQTSVEQHVPFGAIIVQGTATRPSVQSTVTNGAPAQSRVTATQPKIVTPPPNTQPRESSQLTTHKKPHPYHRRVAARESDDVTVDDVTVRHFPSPARRPVQQQAKFKRYSDLE
jgi:hypothetical protein